MEFFVYWYAKVVDLKNCHARILGNGSGPCRPRANAKAIIKIVYMKRLKSFCLVRDRIGTVYEELHSRTSLGGEGVRGKGEGEPFKV